MPTLGTIQEHYLLCQDADVGTAERLRLACRGKAGCARGGYIVLAEVWRMSSTSNELDRFRGCLLGLAVGDAVGTTVEFEPRGSRSRI
jgi:hypothetical protein